MPISVFSLTFSAHRRAPKFSQKKITPKAFLKLYVCYIAKNYLAEIQQIADSLTKIGLVGTMRQSAQHLNFTKDFYP